jgi:VanZ family protein
VRGRHPPLERAWLAVGWLGVVAVVWLSLMPEPPRLDMVQGDKLQHLAAYGSLMLWFAQVAVARHPRMRAAILLVALGVALEFAQRATGYRTFSYADMAANALGVACGWLLAPPRLPNMLRIVERIAARRAAD